MNEIHNTCLPYHGATALHSIILDNDVLHVQGAKQVVVLAWHTSMLAVRFLTGLGGRSGVVCWLPATLLPAWAAPGRGDALSHLTGVGFWGLADDPPAAPNASWDAARSPLEAGLLDLSLWSGLADRSFGAGLPDTALAALSGLLFAETPLLSTIALLGLEAASAATDAKIKSY